MRFLLELKKNSSTIIFFTEYIYYVNTLEISAQLPRKKNKTHTHVNLMNKDNTLIRVSRKKWICKLELKLLNSLKNVAPLLLCFGFDLIDLKNE